MRGSNRKRVQIKSRHRGRMKIYFLIKLKEIVKMLLPPKTNKIIKLLRLLFNAYTLDIIMDVKNYF